MLYSVGDSSMKIMFTIMFKFEFFLKFRINLVCSRNVGGGALIREGALFTNNTVGRCIGQNLHTRNSKIPNRSGILSI